MALFVSTLIFFRDMVTVPKFGDLVFLIFVPFHVSRIRNVLGINCRLHHYVNLHDHLIQDFHRTHVIEYIILRFVITIQRIFSGYGRKSF